MTDLVVVLLILVCLLRLPSDRLAAVVLQVELERLRERDGGEHADAWREREHQADHHPREVHRAERVQDDWNRGTRLERRNAMTEGEAR